MDLQPRDVDVMAATSEPEYPIDKQGVEFSS